MYVIKENSHCPVRNIWYKLHVLFHSKVGSDTLMKEANDVSPTKFNKVVRRFLANLTSILQSFHIQNEYLMKISIIINK